MKKRKKSLKKHELCMKGKHWYYEFLGVKGDLFQCRKLVERSFLSIYGTNNNNPPPPIRWYFLWHGILYLLITEKLLFYTIRRWKYGLFWAKKLMGRWYLQITKKLFWPFRRWEIRSSLSQKIDGKIIFTDYWKVFVLNFSEMENIVFFQ